jgi:hypothetical protein
LTYDTNNPGSTIKNSILVENSALAVKDNVNGKVYFINKEIMIKQAWRLLTPH